MKDIPEQRFGAKVFLERRWCVYFLFEMNKLVYIGKTGTLERRIEAHLKNKKFDEFSFIKVETEEEALYLESELIKKYNPILNKKGAAHETEITKDYFSKSKTKDMSSFTKDMLLESNKKTVESINMKLTFLKGANVSRNKINKILKIKNTVIPKILKGYETEKETKEFELKLETLINVLCTK